MQLTTILKLINKEDLIKKAIEATDTFFKVDNQTKTKVSLTGMALLNIIKDSDFGCQKENIVKLMEVLTNESLLPTYKQIKKSEKYKPIELACFVITHEDSGFDVDDKCIIIDINDRDMIVNNKNGDYSYDSDIFENMRKMTVDEITEFINSLYA